MGDRQTTLLEAEVVGGEAPQAQAAAPLAIQDSGSVGLFERLARDPNVDVDKLERLMQMNERALARQAEFLFNEAMSAAQKEMKAVIADSDNDQTRSRYASYDALDEEVRPVYTKHGFALSFNTGEGAPDQHVRILCKVTHSGGHTERYQLDMPADGKGAKGGDVMTKTHAVGSATSYGRRYLLAMIFNIAIKRDDDDGNAAAGRRAPDAPDGFEAWVAVMEGAAAGGTAEFGKSWNQSKEEFRTYLTRHHPKKLAALRTTANQNTPRGRR